MTGLAANTWAPGFTRTFNGITYNYNNVFDTWYRQFNFDNLTRTYDGNALDANVYALRRTDHDLATNWQATTAYTVGQVVDPVNTANGYTYVCVQAGTSGTAPAPYPDPFNLSDTVVAFPPGDLNPLPPPGHAIVDGTVLWNAQPPVALQAIQITVKYLDPTQNLLRQVTIVQSLTQ